ncbi:carotenoid oxygenase family protein [Actinospongicola halichondriae]|uniref:carotenoid oxygenase family protein n=1 Tax=Actinospongicola halichondriae TaxID=3236844 RepID=UPI003D50769D
MTDAMIDRRTSENSYLAGNFAPLPDEVTAFDLPVVQGQLPPELSGRYLRIGPNPVAAEAEGYHWFTGTGMVHGIRLDGGRAEWYRSRFVRAGGILEQQGWDDPGGPAGVMQGAVNTNVIGLAGRTFACVEAGSNPIELSDELETIGRADFSGPATAGIPGPFSAHPKRDPDTGDLHVVAYYWGWDTVQYQVIGADGVVKHTADIAVPGKPMMHDLSITETHVILYDLPVTFDLDMAMTGAGLPYRWDEDYGARVGVLPKGGTADQVKWYDVEPCYVFHPMNAHDLDDGRIVLDIVRHPSMFRTDMRGPNEGNPTLDRWTIDPAAGRVTEERLDDHPLEFPRIDERLVGKRARYGYAGTFDGTSGGLQFGPLMRWDSTTGTRILHDYGPNRLSMEAVFIPRTPDSAEDDGWVMSVTYDVAEDTSHLVLLNGQDFAGEPACTIALPNRVPYGFHGNWVAD